MMSILRNKNIIRSFRIVWNSSPLWTVVNAVIVLLRGVVPLLLIFIIKMLIDQVALAVEASESINKFVTVANVLLFAGGVFILNAIVNSLSVIVNEKQSYLINDKIQDMIHARTTTLDYANYEDYNFQNIFFRAINEATYRPSRIFYGFVGLIQNTITLALIGGLLLNLHWLMVLLLAFISVPIIWVRLNYSNKIFTIKRAHTDNERLVGYHNKLLTGKEFAKELRVFDLAALFKGRYEGLKNDLRVQQFELLKIKTRYELLIQVVTAVALFLVFGYIAKEAVDKNITQGEMVMYFLALYRGYSFLQDLLSRITGLYEDNLFLKNFFDFIDYKLVQNKESQREEFPKKIQESISIRNVNFKYPNSSRCVFENLNLTIQPNETVAVVGANGAGKTTLIKLLCGLYYPDSGTIKVDNVNLNSINRSSLARNVSVVFQDFMLYNVTAKENIWFGDINHPIDSESLTQSAEKAGVDGLLRDLAKGYDTTLGNLFKDSEMLSVGEWQRMALARSFFNDAQLVILDEPTSSLDAFTESRLIRNFKEITKDRTAIIVSHRFSTIKMADRVIVLNEHGVAEEGAFDQLIQNRGVLYDMVESMKTYGIADE